MNEVYFSSRRPSLKKLNEVYFSSRLPSLKKLNQVLDLPFQNFLVICDLKLKNNPILQTWLKHPLFHFYFVKSGEDSKSIERLSFHLKKIFHITLQLKQTEIVFISVGGGSIGDLTGFLASIYKRGMPLVHIPTTYLAALDSSYGGKTALNFQNVKNFVGTYWFPQAIFIVKSFFKTLSNNQKESAYGELLKMALIGGGSFYQSIDKSSMKNISEEEIKRSLHLKHSIVQKDPFDIKSIRKVLNFGHTVGHILESNCGLSHGVAVSQGLLFAVNWSFQKRFLNHKFLTEIRTLIPFKSYKISQAQFIKGLRKDKKYCSPSYLDFVFIKRPGKVFLKSVSETDLVQEAHRQGIF